MFFINALYIDIAIFKFYYKISSRKIFGTEELGYYSAITMVIVVISTLLVQYSLLLFQKFPIYIKIKI